MFTRALTGGMLLTVMILSIWMHLYSALALFLLIGIASLFEFYGLLSKGGCSVNYVLGISTSLAIYCCAYLATLKILPLTDWIFALLPLVLLPLAIRLFSAWEKPTPNAMITLFGVLYISLPFALITFVALPGGGDYNHWGLLAYFILVWTNDTGAYLAGISMGRHKLAKRISPKKTWEGSIGGFIMSILAALLMWHLQITSFQLQDWLIISSVVVVFGNLGDLAESNLKRALDLKDSGGLLPGHGGLLDRFDAVLFSAPLVLFYLGFLRQFL